MTQEQKTPPAIEAGARLKNKRPYRKPLLTRFGDIRSKTLSPTLDPGLESGNGAPYYFNTP